MVAMGAYLDLYDLQDALMLIFAIPAAACAILVLVAIFTNEE